MGLPRQEYWSGLPSPSPVDLPDPGIEPQSLAGGSNGKESAFSAEDPGSILGLGRSPEENGYPFLPGEFHGQRSLGGYSPWGCKELDTTE